MQEEEILYIMCYTMSPWSPPLRTQIAKTNLEYYWWAHMNPAQANV